MTFSNKGRAFEAPLVGRDGRLEGLYGDPLMVRLRIFTT
jgi:hypothetical protein